MNEFDPLDLVNNLRGGVPANCDFCRKAFTKENYAVPEEAGDWACIECIKRWDNERT